VTPLASRLKAEAAAYREWRRRLKTWRSLWLGIEDETNVDIPLEVRWYLQRGDTFEDVYDLSIVSTDPTEFWSLPNNLLYRDNLTFGTDSTLAVESYTITEVSTVPKPSAWSMFGVGSVAFVGIMLRKKHRTA